jgi:hypothetical protein
MALDPRRNSDDVTSDQSGQWQHGVHVSVIWKSNCWHGCYSHHILKYMHITSLITCEEAIEFVISKG